MAKLAIRKRIRKFQIPESQKLKRIQDSESGIGAILLIAARNLEGARDPNSLQFGN